MAILKSTFLEYGKPAPKNSSFRGIINENTVFGDHGLKAYYARKDAIKKSGDKKTYYSFFDYTQRDYAVLHSDKKETIYHTYSNIGYLTEKNEKEWLQQAISSFSKKGNLFWQEVLAFEKYDESKSYGLCSQSDYAVLMEKCVPRIAKAIGINYTNLIWWEDYHTDTSHPHIHFNFLEKEQTITKGKLPKKKLDRIKRIIYTELYDRKRTIDEKSSLEFKQEIDDKKKDILNSISVTSEKLSYKTVNKIFNLYVRLEDTGRLQFNSIHQKSKRKELLEIADMILEDSVGKEDYQNFVNLLLENDRALNSVSKENVFHNATTNLNDLKVKIANIVLQAYKNDETKKDIEGSIGINHTNLKDNLIEEQKTSENLIDDFDVKKVKKARKKYLEKNDFSKNSKKSKAKRKDYILNKHENNSFSHKLQKSILSKVNSQIHEYLTSTKTEINAYIRNTDEVTNIIDDFEIIKNLEKK